MSVAKKALAVALFLVLLGYGSCDGTSGRGTFRSVGDDREPTNIDCQIDHVVTKDGEHVSVVVDVSSPGSLHNNPQVVGLFSLALKDFVEAAVRLVAARTELSSVVARNESGYEKGAIPTSFIGDVQTELRKIIHGHNQLTEARVIDIHLVHEVP